MYIDVACLFSFIVSNFQNIYKRYGKGILLNITFFGASKSI